jgi:peptidoglycan/xylan/chitin deacetylase (PgdA/CDA1 family)
MHTLTFDHDMHTVQGRTVGSSMPVLNQPHGSRRQAVNSLRPNDWRRRTNQALAEVMARLPFRRLVRKNLLILCYHGFARDDEAEFNPGMFMRRETFAQRMVFLKLTGWPILTLADALERLEADDLPAGAVVLTADDGWVGTVDIAEELLFPLGFPMTNYVTTHYVTRRFPVSNVMLAYLLWKGRGALTSSRTLDIGGERFSFDSAEPSKLQRALLDLSSGLSAAERDRLNECVASEIEVDYTELKVNKLLHLMDPAEVKRAEHAGVDIQLHGDRHLGGRMLDDEELFKQEIQANRQTLSHMVASTLDHFCYPSGAFHPRQERWLSDLEVRSAVTCQPGLNRFNTNRYGLMRYLDREDISLNRFVLELSGLRELVRKRS